MMPTVINNELGFQAAAFFTQNQNWVCGLVLLSLSLYRSSCFLFVSQFLLCLLFVHLETIWLYSSRLVFHSYLPSNAMNLNGKPNTAFGHFNQQHVEFQTISCSFQQSGPTKTGISDQQKKHYHRISPNLCSDQKYQQKPGFLNKILFLVQIFVRSLWCIDWYPPVN